MSVKGSPMESRMNRQKTDMEPLMRSLWNGPPIWYFAYGSNMKAQSMTKRGITPLDARAIQVPGFYLNFDIFGIPFSEPCYASIEEFPIAQNSTSQLESNSKRLDIPAVCGIAYLLSPEGFHRLLATEDGGVIYEVIKLTATYQDPNIVKHESKEMPVYTLKARYPRRPNGIPSLRYMTLLRDGAETMKLPQTYREYLYALPDYSKPGIGEEPTGMWIFTYLWRPFVLTATKLHKYKVDDDGKCPPWVAVFLLLLYKSMWAYHDYIHRRIFTNGDGGEMPSLHSKTAVK